MESRGVAEHDYGTDCKDCERYRTLGDICVVEHGKKFLWEYCKDFEPVVVLPEYKELMRSVRSEMALERKKAKEKRERERKRKAKERQLALEAKKKARRSRLRKKRLLEKKRKQRLEQRLHEGKVTKRNQSTNPNQTEVGPQDQLDSQEKNNSVSAVKAAPNSFRKNKPRAKPRSEDDVVS
ncbi:MAG: hypothetical protein M1587_08905 [Thaumarchaeota archaeon]|nr:hypothetical protein [Nitrososphaerota archaeon]